MHIQHILIIFSLFIISACDESSNSEAPEIQTPDAYGTLLDSKVSGIKYISGSYVGVTNEDGEFKYITGETIQFFVGDIAIGEQVTPQSILTPYDLANNNPLLSLNIARFLQSLDNDATLDNGIQIHESSHTLAKGKTLDFLSLEWDENDTNYSSIESLVHTLTQDTDEGARYLIDKFEAYAHFSSTLDGFMSDKLAEIENEINLNGCASNNDCKIVTILNASIYNCIINHEYLYSDTTTDTVKINELESERERIRSIKSSIYNVSTSEREYGLCLIQQDPLYPYCNSEAQCEYSGGLPVQ